MTTKGKTKSTKKSKPASNPDSREKQLTKLAVDLAEKQLKEGTASPSIINHYLKIASNRESLERDILKQQAEMIKAKASNLANDKEAEELARAAIDAMKSYAPGS